LEQRAEPARLPYFVGTGGVNRQAVQEGAEREDGMSGKRRYGVFRLGQIWSVVAGDGRAVGFATRREAVSAAHALAAAEQKQGSMAEVVLQDELGCLTNVPAIGLAIDAGLAVEAMKVVHPRRG
jgi:hypothetical protein